MRSPEGNSFRPMPWKSLKRLSNDDLIDYVKRFGQQDWRATLFLVQVYQDLLSELDKMAAYHAER
jgi:hypothetical protein